MLLPLIAITFVAVGVALFALGAALVTPSSPLSMRLKSVLGYRPVQKTTLKDRVDNAMEPLGHVVPVSAKEVSRTRALLMSAGYREQRHVTYFFGIRGALLVGVIAFALLTGIFWRSPLTAIALAAFAYMLPRFILKRRIKTRQHALRLALPDALDLAVICVEAGLGLDQAIQRVGDDLRFAHPELSDEFSLVNLEIRAGKPRAEALRNLADRTGVDDLRALVAVLVQTDRFGTSVAQALRVHSDSLRTERRQRAEEQAAKTTIKMVPVLVLCIFPAMFIISLGPAAIQLIRHLLPAIQK